MFDTAGVKLLQYGRKNVVLGVDPDNLQGVWHIVNPGSWRGALIGDLGKTVGTALCKRYVITNGYCADWVPADKALCQACKERL